jgi:hypothetical protein
MQTRFDSLFSERRAAITKRWLEAILQTYPAETSRFLAKERDPIANPAGQTFAREVGPLVDRLVASGGIEREVFEPHLDPIVRVRTVQDFSASEALSFILELKKIVREVLAPELGAEPELDTGLVELEGRIDRLLLLAFEIYLGCKEKMYEIRVNEMKRRTNKLMERMNKVYGAASGE